MGEGTEEVHGYGFEDQYGSVVMPIYLSTPFRQVIEPRLSDRGVDLKYSREENPTVRFLEGILAKLEGGDDALALNSGMAAISTTLIGLSDSNTVIIIPAEVYGTTLSLVVEMSKFGVKHVLTMPETHDVVEAVKGVRGSCIVFVETITNPMLRVIDVDEVSKAARDAGCRFIVDNTMATPILYKPLKHGADLVIHSTTKYLSGHNDTLGGAIIGGKDAVINLWNWRRRLGTIMQPFEAYLTIRGLKTLSLRVRRHCDNAKAIAEYLADHSKVREVYYPGLKNNPYYGLATRMFNGLYGGIVSFKVRGGVEEVRRFLNSLKVIKPAPSFGGPESLIMYPITSAAQPIPIQYRVKLGIDESLLRLSVGLEDVEDLINDLDQALRQIP